MPPKEHTVFEHQRHPRNHVIVYTLPDHPEGLPAANLFDEGVLIDRAHRFGYDPDDPDTMELLLEHLVLEGQLPQGSDSPELHDLEKARQKHRVVIQPHVLQKVKAEYSVTREKIFEHAQRRGTPSLLGPFAVLQSIPAVKKKPRPNR